MYWELGYCEILQFFLFLPLDKESHIWLVIGIWFNGGL